MCAKQVKYIPFKNNLLTAVLPGNDSRADSALYIFPTEASRQAAIREFQSRWSFENIRFLTMEELKQELFVSEKPLLIEEKRTLAFYSALTSSDKQFFKINNYFQSIELAQNFFDLWEELNEERVAVDQVIERLDSAGLELLNWQRSMWERFISIRTNYHSFLQGKGFDDVLFTHVPDLLQPEFMQEFDSIHFVNQFYYTNLEKMIIDRLEKSGVDVTLYYQLPQHLVDEQNLSIVPFSIKDLGAGCTQRVDIIECKSEFSMLRAMIENIESDQVRHVVNFSELKNPHTRLLSQARFSVGSSSMFTETSIYRFIQHAHSLVDNLVFEPSRKKMLLPLQSMLDVLLDELFAKTIVKDGINRKHILHYLYDLLDRDYRFSDLDGDFFAGLRNNSAQEALQNLLAFVQQLLSMQSIDDLVALVDAPGGIDIDRIMSEDEKILSNARELFYRALADFRSLAHLNIVDDWKSLFENRRLAPQAQNAAGILKLFLDYLKSRSIRFNTAPVDKPRVDFTSLQNTRNLAFKNVIVANVVEKEIPHARQTPFLFTERQRKGLGLKIYDDIKLREKYYLHRLVLTTPRVTLLTQKNIEQNIDVSSFVEEIRLYLPSDSVHAIAYQREDYSGVYTQLLHSNKNYAVDQNKTSVLDFYTIDLALKRDFPNKSIDLSYYSLSNLLSNPFTFYVKNIVRLQEKTKEADTDFTPKLIGNIVHESLNVVWRDFLAQQGIPPYRIDFKNIPEDILTTAMRKTLAMDRFYYAVPHNYSDIYFREIIVPRVLDGIQNFFIYLDRIGLSKQKLFIYPEKDGPMLRDAYIPFITSDKIDFCVNVGGRADLRIEADEAKKYFIFDYKTGGMNKEQLILYELYYYLIENRALSDSVFSYFYQLFDAEGKELGEFNSRSSKQDVIELFEEKVKVAVRELWQFGFKLPTQKSALTEMQDITRADLYSAKYLPMVNQAGLL
jgi:hypothetical protein